MAVDPDGRLPLAERYARADALRAAFYIGQGLKARRRNRDSKTPDGGAPETAINPNDRRHDLELADERRLRGRMGGLIARSKHDPREVTAKARAAWEGRFEADVDPEGTLPVAERRRRAESARRAFYTRLALASIDARERKARRAGRLGSEQATRYAATRRALKGRIGAYTRAASHDPIELTRRARVGWDKWFTDRLDLDRTLDPDRRAELLQAAKSDYFRKLASRRHRGQPASRIDPRGGEGDVRAEVAEGSGYSGIKRPRS